MKNKWIELTTLLLMAATVTAGFLTTTDVSLLPIEWRPYLPLAIGGIIVLKQIAYGVLDFLDDGVMNKSYKTPTTLIKVMLCLLLPAFLLASCATEQSTDRELTWAKAGVEAAQLTVDLASISYQARLANPQTSAAERIAAARILEEAQARLSKERKRLEDLQARRAAAAALPLPQGGTLTPAATLLLPPLTEAK